MYTQNGVKQGGVLSPTLFAVYMDGLFARLRDNGFGCYIGQHFVGGVGFADDLKLLAPSNKGLQNLVYICEDYAQEFDITFNGSKSQFLEFRDHYCKLITNSQITVNNEILVQDNKAVHLGHSLNSDNKDSIISAAIAQFWSSFNLFRADFGHIQPYVQCKLLNSFAVVFMGYHYGYCLVIL